VIYRYETYCQESCSVIWVEVQTTFPCTALNVHNIDER